MRRWGLLRQLQRGSEGGLRDGTDERLARPRMTGDGHPYLWEVSPRMNGTVIRTFPRPLLLVLLGDFSTSC